MPQIEADGTRIHYTDTGGDGPPLVLLHAFPLNSGMWEAQASALSGKVRVIAPDLPGFGSSSAPEDPSAYSMDAWASNVKTLKDELGLEQIILAGLSMGGYVAFAFWRRYADDVRALVLADTRAEEDPPEGKEKRTGQQETVREQGIAPLKEALPGALLGETTRSSKPDVVERLAGLMENPATGYIGALEAMKDRPDSTSDLASINVPTLIVVGEEDTLTPPDLSRKMHEHIGGSELAVVPGAGHLSNLESPDAFNGAISGFLAKL